MLWRCVTGPCVKMWHAGAGKASDEQAYLAQQPPVFELVPAESHGHTDHH